MKILGLNFGHDAGVSLIVDGVFERHWEKERHTRTKHAMGLTASEILTALSYLGVRLEEIDRIALTCTQDFPVMLFGDIDMGPKDSGWPRDGIREMVDVRESRAYNNVMKGKSWYRQALAGMFEPPAKELLFTEDLLGPKPIFGQGLAELARHRGRYTGRGRDMCIGVECSLAGTMVPGAYVSHHLCHAYYAYLESQFDRALVITLDGATAPTFKAGGIYFGAAGTVQPAVPHNFWCGTLYEYVAARLLGPTAAGKLMGLSAWGKPDYYDEALVGNWQELPPEYSSLHRGDFNWTRSAQRAAEHWMRKLEGKSRFMRLQACEVPPAREANLAASVQKMFEQTMLKVVEAADGIAKNAGFDYEAIVLGGGCALNCPANSLIYRKFGKPVVIPPAINDEGISAGAALALHSLLGGKTLNNGKRSMGQIAYKGRPYVVSRADVEPYLAHMEFVETRDPAAYLAGEIAGGAIVGLFEKGAEIGPRALGHRSLVGSPLIAANWPRLNTLKGREQWRPFAPIVLPEDADTYFDGFPPDSYYMLFNARARTKALPAVTHVDGTARVQIAHPDNGFAYALLQAFKAACGYGVLINTSFNGPNEPIVETPHDALQAFRKMGFDFLYLDGFVLRRRQGSIARE